MSDYEKLSRVRRNLEEIRTDLSKRIAEGDGHQAELTNLHARVSQAIKALSCQD